MDDELTPEQQLEAVMAGSHERRLAANGGTPPGVANDPTVEYAAPKEPQR